MNQKKDIPKTLYRYRSMTKSFEYEAIANNYSYHAHTNTFNDPFEFVADLTLSIPHPSYEWDKFKEVNENWLHISNDDICSLIGTQQIDDAIALQEQKSLSVLEDLYKRYDRDTVCCCYTAVNDHPLMWGHYGNGLRGLVLGFDTDELTSNVTGSKEEILREVSYAENNKIPLIDYTPMVAAPKDSERWNELWEQAFIKRFCTKSSHWEYEKEYRTLRTRKEGEPWNQKVKHSASALVEIIFGELMPDEQRDVVRKILNGRNIQYKEARRSISHYALEISDLP